MKTADKPKLILIARVSDEDQEKALGAQQEQLEKYATLKGYKEGEWDYHQFNESAYKGARQEFAKLIEKNIQSLDQPAIVVFDKIDRFTRDASQKEVKIMSQLVDDGKIELHFPSDNLFITKDSPATDKFRLGIGMLLAKYYSDASRDNVIRRFTQMLNAGIWVHRAPIGYKNVNLGLDARGRKIKDIHIDKDKAPYIIKAYEMRARGVSYAVIARELHEMGFSSNKSTRPVTKAFIERILNNRFYYGQMKHNGVYYDHKYPTLISKGLFDTCQRVREERKHIPTKYDSKDFTFKKIVLCGVCKRAISPFKARNSVYLRCANVKCKNPNVAEKSVLGKVVDDMSYIDVPEEFINKVTDELRNRHDNQQLYYSHSIEQTRVEYDQIAKKLRVLYDDRLDGRITIDQYDEKATQLTSRQQELNDRLDLLTNDNKSFSVNASYLLDLAQRAVELFNCSDEGLRQQLLEYLLANIELKDKSLSYILNEPFRTIVEAKKKALSGQNSNIWCG